MNRDCFICTRPISSGDCDKAEHDCSKCEFYNCINCNYFDKTNNNCLKGDKNGQDYKKIIDEGKI